MLLQRQIDLHERGDRLAQVRQERHQLNPRGPGRRGHCPGAAVDSQSPAACRPAGTWTSSTPAPCGPCSPARADARSPGPRKAKASAMPAGTCRSPTPCAPGGAAKPEPHQAHCRRIHPSWPRPEEGRRCQAWTATHSRLAPVHAAGWPGLTPWETSMALLRQVPNRNRKLTVPITAELEQRLESIRQRCQERHMELPFQDAFEAFLDKLIEDAEAELSGAPPSSRKRRVRRWPEGRQRHRPPSGRQRVAPRPPPADLEPVLPGPEKLPSAREHDTGPPPDGRASVAKRRGRARELKSRHGDRSFSG